MMIAKKCQCGAVTVSDDDFDNSMSFETFEQEYPGMKLEKNIFCNCNHCVNHWGIDLCGCGSGETVGECEGDFPECINKIPSQIKGESKKFVGWIL